MADNPYEELIQNPQATPPAAGPVVPGAAAADRMSNIYENLINEPPRPPQPKQRKPGEPFGELRPAEYNWRETIGNKAQDVLIAAGAQPYVAGRVGRGALDAASLIPPVGATISGLDTHYYATRDDPLMAGANMLGTVPGGTAMRRAYSGMPTRTLAPEEQQLGRAKEQAYDAWRNRPVVYSPSMMDDAVNEITRTLIQRGFDPALKQSALNTGLNLKKQTGMTNNDFEILRRQLGGGKDRTEVAAGEVAKEVLENYMTNSTNLLTHHRSGSMRDLMGARDDLLRGRGNAAAEFRSEVITGKQNLAEIAEERGRSFTGTFRDRMGGLSSGTKASEKALRGFTDAEREAVRNEVAGSLAERTAGSVGKGLERFSPYMGLGGGASTAAAGALGKSFGLDPVTAFAAGTGVAAGGSIAGKGLGEYATNLSKRSADELSAGLRMRSPLAQAQGSPYGAIIDPAAMVSDARKYMMYPWLRQQGEEYAEGERTPFEYR